MSNTHFQIRPATSADLVAIMELYQAVAEVASGIIRRPQEIKTEYIQDFLVHSLADGLILLIENPDNQEVIAEIHAYKYGIEAFAHILGDLTIVVHPTYQSQGLGKQIFTTFLQIIEEKFSEVLRVELFVREKNQKAIAFYQKLGFVIEGKLTNRILNSNGELETPLAMAWFNPNFRKVNEN
jgi:ribosomal protein S18 acetylase RimI-like enzyme